jgi:imidazolonepropionase-like amidohydrolase
MYTLKIKYPGLSARRIVEMACVGGARALGYGGQLGKLQRDFLADIIGIRLNHDEKYDIYDEIVNEVHEVTAVVINGEEIII